MAWFSERRVPSTRCRRHLERLGVVHAMGTLARVCAALLLTTMAGAQAPTAQVTDRLWVGPMPFAGPRDLRPDFFDTITNPAAWPTVLSHTDVFKSYLMVLPADPVPGKTAPELPDTQMAELASFFRDRSIRVAFEVGGLRMGPDKPQRGQWGKQVAEGEFRHLKRWLDAGGSIDYLTTDHAVMANLGHRVAEGTDCRLTLAEVLEELGDYFAEMTRRIPGVRVGCIESLGFFHVAGPDGSDYPRTVPTLPVWRFEEYFDLLLATLRRRGLTLDHFHIDFGYEGVAYDGRRLGRDGLDFGRVLGVERFVQSRGVRAGVIVNAFHDQTVEQPDPAVASREAQERTLAFLSGYAAAGGRAEHLVLQTWQPFPDRTGPEDEPGTVLHLDKRLLTSEAMRVLLPDLAPRR